MTYYSFISRNGHLIVSKYRGYCHPFEVAHIIKQEIGVLEAPTLDIARALARTRLTQMAV